MEVPLAAAAGGEAGGVVRGLLSGEGGVEGGRGSGVAGFGFVACAAAANADGGGVGGVGLADVEGGGEGHCCRWWFGLTIAGIGSFTCCMQATRQWCRVISGTVGVWKGER